MLLGCPNKTMPVCQEPPASRVCQSISIIRDIPDILQTSADDHDAVVYQTRFGAEVVSGGGFDRFGLTNY